MDPTTTTKIGVVLGSSRDQRLGDRVTRWVIGGAKEVSEAGGVTAGHELRLVINKLGMLPLPRTIPLAHADQLLDPDGSMVAESHFATVVAQLLPYLLRELAYYAAALRPLRQEINSWKKPWRD